MSYHLHIRIFHLKNELTPPLLFFDFQRSVTWSLIVGQTSFNPRSTQFFANDCPDRPEIKYPLHLTIALLFFIMNIRLVSSVCAFFSVMYSHSRLFISSILSFPEWNVCFPFKCLYFSPP